MDVCVHVNDSSKEYFFSTDHCQGVRVGALYPEGKGWVPCTHPIPQHVAPRDTLPSGVIETVADLITVYYSDAKEIPNPDPRYQPKSCVCTKGNPCDYHLATCVACPRPCAGHPT